MSQEFGLPNFLIHTDASKATIADRYKKANEVDDIGEEAQQELTDAATKDETNQKEFEARFEQSEILKKMHTVTTDTMEDCNKALKNIFSAKVVLVNHEKRLDVDIVCSNLAIKYNFLYISVYQLKDHLHGVCCGMKDSLGLMKSIEKTYASFVRLVQDQNFEYDTLRQLNFSNGYCYDVATKATRRIRPSDGAKLCTGYPYPEFDANKDAELEVFLEEVHPDPDVRRFRISELAKCLNMAQNEPCVRFCFGTAGAGKGITTRLFLKAVGDYGGEFDKSLFARPRDGGENATPARLQLKNKVYVVVNEVAGFDSSTLKQWCGSDQIVARALYGQPVKFFGTFNLTEITFNDMISIKKDEGLERRCCAIRFSSQFVSCADEQGAMAAQQQWERDGEEGKFAMHDQKYERIMALAPQLMARLIRIHQAGDYEPRYPAKVEQWNAELWAESAPENPLQLPMSLWYTRCGCMPRDTADDTTCDLVDVNGNQCTHSIQAKDIMPKLKAKKLPNGDTLYKQVKGRGRSDEPVLAMLQRVHLGSPALRLACVERRGEERNVFFGLKHAGNAFQRIMPAGAGGQFED